MTTNEFVWALLFFSSVGIILYAYAGYPILIWMLSRVFGRTPQRPTVDDAALPRMSLLIAAYNEQGEIGHRIENALETDYPPDRFEIVVASDGSIDRTNEIVRQYERYGVKLLAFERRRGKANVLNDAIPTLAGEIVMLSDANTYTHASAAHRLAFWFAEPTIGVVCGRLVLTDPATGRNVDGLYWKYETFIKNCENRLGALLGSNGGIYAIRKSLFRPIPGNTIVDDFVIPLLARKQSGCRIVYDKEAVATEETPARLRAEFHRRARIGAGGFQSIGLLAGLLNPANGWLSFSFACHKVLRWMCPFAMLTALLANALLIGRTAFLCLFISQLAFYAVSLAAGWLPAGPRVCRYPRLGTMFTMMNAALLVGFVRWVRGRQGATWKRTERVPEPSPETGMAPLAQASTALANAAS